MRSHLFHEQQKYIYSVLLNTVKTSALKSIVINARKDNIQQCWDDIVHTAKCSTSAEIKAVDFLQYITLAKFDDGKWQGTSKDFIHWCEQLCQYEELCKDGIYHFSDAAKTQMLQNTLDNVTEFQTICTTAQQTGHAVTGSSPHSFENYKALVLSAVDTYDAKWAAKQCPIHNTFYHDLGDHDLHEDYHDDGYNINTTINTIYTNAAKTCISMIPNESFHQMSEDVRGRPTIIGIYLKWWLSKTKQLND